MASTSDTRAAALTEGQAALDDGDWDRAKRAFEAALLAGASAEAWDGLGWAAWWLSEEELTIEAREQAYRAYRDAGDAGGAARIAAFLSADFREFRSEVAVARGWLELAQRALVDQPLSADHGWVAVLQADQVLNTGDDLPEVRRLCEEARRIGLAHGVADLEAIALAQGGVAAVMAGEVGTGMRALDEASAIVAAEDLYLPISAGWVMCSLITACDGVGDFARAEEWCAAAKRFTDHWGGRQLAGVCRSSYGRVLATRGDWEAAEREMTAALEDFTLSRRAGMAGGSHARLGELRARQGRTDEARALFEEAGPVGLLGLGGLALEAGDARAAADTAARVLRSLRDDTVLPRLPALELQVRALAALGEDTSGSLAAAQEIATRLGTPYLRARVRLLTGEAALAAGDADSAREAFEDAIDGFDAHAAPYDLALSRLALARALHALGRTEHARLEAAAAREVFAALGAKRDLERADELTAEPAAAALSELTPRELDVLRLVAQGHSDQEIADALVLSPHTVHRHVANIRAKLRLSSRAAAVAVVARAR
ncbi:MAG: LuxR C-terminal-related transcriptional regulator, partial [Baekduiaceae bacterium]